MDRLRQPTGHFGWWVRNNRQVLRRIGFGLAGFVGFVLFVQILYPTGRTLPFVKVSGEPVGAMSTAGAQKKIDKAYAKATVTVKTEDKSFTRPLEEVGVSIESKDAISQAATYRFWQRIIPFSSVFIMANRDVPITASFDDDRVKYFAQEVNKQGFVASVNAAVAIKGTKVELVPSKPSKEYSVQAVELALHKAMYEPKTVVQVSAHKKAAERTNDEVKSLLNDAQKAVDTPLTLLVNGEKNAVDKATIASWLDFPEDPATKKLQLGLKGDTVTKYLDTAQKKIYKAPGTTTVKVIDGVEASRELGVPGRGVDVAKTISLVDTALRKGTEHTIDLPIAQIAPKIVYQRSYSNTQAGLQALVTDLAARGVGISVRELGGSGRAASANGGKPFAAASTYKLFVAYAVMKEIEAGRMTWNDGINGKSVSECFDIMIVRSDNPCAKALGEKLGWQNVENQMRGLGLGSTRLNTGNMVTTANDLTLYLTKLQEGALLNAGDTARLIDLMKRQIYRSGIPAGAGMTVANKPGFVDNVIHDAAIVYGPKGPYVLTIMTNSTWGTIADIARQIQANLNG